MKLDKMAIANAVALWSAIAWVVCAGLVIVFPGLYGLVSRWWIHWLDLSKLNPAVMTLPKFVGGGATFVAVGWLSGWLFGWCWEKASKK